jgi:uncharacterized damage-inducible protein DinB
MVVRPAESSTHRKISSRPQRQSTEITVPAHDENLLAVILDSWDRNNRILVNLLRALPEEGLEARATSTSKSVAEMFTHMNYVRLIFLVEDAPEFALSQPPREWHKHWRQQIAAHLLAELAEEFNTSAAALRNAVHARTLSGRPLDLHYDHPLLFLQHMIWHEGYHHGQIKLALKLAGHPFEDEAIGPLTWDIWLGKTQPQ